MRTMDIYNKMGTRLEERNFLFEDINTQKEMIDVELRRYISEKITDLNPNMIPEQQKELSALELLEVLATLIPKEQHFDTLRHFTHYILNIAGIMQGYEIIWFCEDRQSLIECPEVVFDENNKLEHLTTNENTDYIKSFAFIYDIFQHSFMEKQPTKKLEGK